MKKFTTDQGVVIPLDRANVDTDFIIPKQFLKSIKRTGFGPNLFDEHRYLDKGEPDSDNSQRTAEPGFCPQQTPVSERNYVAGKGEFWLRIKPRARALGVR